MKIRFWLVALLAVLLLTLESCQENTEQKIEFIVDASVINANDPDAQEIISLWQGYIKSGEYKNRDSVYWSFDQLEVPDYFMWPLLYSNGFTGDAQVQCKVLGVFPVEHGYYNVKSSFSHVDENGEVQLDGIISVFAKKYEDQYLLVNSSQYYAEVWEQHQVGNITYYVHPEHPFNQEDADKMHAFNQEMAQKFDMEPLKFDYFVTNYAREIVELWGHDYMPKMYIPKQSGGLADIENRIVYAGNNSEYYPHEVVHLYTYAKVTTFTHFWVQEGIATYFGGSGGKDFAWHVNELKTFLDENPDFRLNDLSVLNVYIPNGKHMTDFRYVIGALITQEIYQKEGIQGLIESLETGPSDEAFFALLKSKLNVDQSNFETYIRELLQ